MKIAYFTGRYPSISHTFILREAQALRELGVEVLPFSVWKSAPDQLLARADRDEAERTYSLLPPKRSDWARAHLRGLRAGLGTYLATLWRSLRLSQPDPHGLAMGVLWFAQAIVLWDRCHEAEIEHVHAHLNGTAPSVAMLAAGFARDVGSGPRTWSATVHGPSEFYEVRRERLAEKVAAADLVVCISDFARSQLMGLVDESHWDKLEVVHCGVDPELYQSHSTAGNANGAPLEILTVGRLVQVKGQAVLLEAVRELRARDVDVNATVVGDGPKRAELERLAAQLGLEASVTFAGAISQEEIGSYYERADLFCLSSFAEGIPVVLMEAMAMRLPVVAPLVMGIGELVENGVSGALVRPGRADLVADAIAGLAGNPGRREAYGDAARRKVMAEFTVAGGAERLRDLFAGVTRTPRGT